MAIKIPETAPVMALRNCNFFPGTPLPLYIFEPRYRAMLEFALETDRMFCMGTVADQTALPRDAESGLYRHATLGLIRACVRGKDGTSQLILEGLCRVIFEGWVRESPFRIARIRPIPTVFGDDAKTRAAGQKLHELAVKVAWLRPDVLPHIKNQILQTEHPEPLADLIAFYLIDDIHARHALLGAEQLLDRISFLTERLRGQLIQFPDASA